MLGFQHLRVTRVKTSFSAGMGKKTISLDKIWSMGRRQERRQGGNGRRRGEGTWSGKLEGSG